MNESQDDVSFNESHTEVSMNMNELQNTTDEFQNMSEMEEEIDEGSDFEMDDREMESKCEVEEQASNEGDLSMEGVIIEEEKQAVIKDDDFQEEIHFYKEQGSVEEKIHLLEDAKTITLLTDEEKMKPMDQNEMKNRGKRISVDIDEEKMDIEYESTSVAGLSDAALQGSAQSTSNIENVETKSSETNQNGANEDCILPPSKILSLVQLAKNVCVHMNIDIPANNSITDLPEAHVPSSLDENSLVAPKTTYVFNENHVAEFHAARQGISTQLKITKSDMCSENTSLVTNKDSTSLLRDLEFMEITSSVTSDSSPEDILEKYDLGTEKDSRKSETPSLFLCGQYMSVSSGSECPVISYGGRKRQRYVDTEGDGSKGIEEENEQKRREDENTKDITSSSPSVFKSSSNLRKSGLHSHLDPVSMFQQF